MNDEGWVKQRFRETDPAGDWRPNAGAAFTRLQHRNRVRRIWRRGWIFSTATASAAAIAMLILPATATCALAGVGCRRIPVELQIKAAPTVVKATEPQRTANYKQSGSPGAPVVCEIYSDYECPSCANFYRLVFPLLMAEFVKTGKVRVVHRDFPLPQHRYARLAARYANAAGELGLYDQVVDQLFATQPQWAGNGNLDPAVARAVPSETMAKLRAMVGNDAQLDATVAADVAMASLDQINQTPTIVFVSKGVRRKVTGIQSFDLLRRYLDEVLAQ
jgi:protein-disulfide isomerase